MGKAQAIRADAGSSADAKEVIQGTVEAFGRLDILVTDAGIYPTSPDLHMREETKGTWDKLVNLNLKGILFCSQRAAFR